MRVTRLKSHLALMTGTAVLLGSQFGLASGAAAQTAPASPAPASSPAPADEASGTQSQGGLGDIVVTARKSRETLVDVPLSVTALDADALSARGVKSYADLNNFVPGFRFQNVAANRASRGFHTFVVRGMFPGSDSPDRQAATVFVDGVPIGGGVIPGMTNIESVEVVNGPQSAYFGRSTFAGAINFTTRQPSFDWHASADGEISSFGGREYNGSVEGGIVPDILAARINYHDYHTDGQYKNTGRSGRLGERNTRAISGSFLLTPIDDLKIRGFVTTWKDRDGPAATARQTTLNCNPRNPGGTPTYYCGEIKNFSRASMTQNTDIPSSSIGLLVDGDPLLPGFMDSLGLRRNAMQAAVSFDYEVTPQLTISGNGGLAKNKYAEVLDTTYQVTDRIYNPYVPYIIHNKTAELRANYQVDGFRAMVGFNYFRQRTRMDTALVTNNTRSYLTSPTAFRTDTYGLFGSLAYDITPKLTASVEARRQIDKIGQQVLTATGVELSDSFKSFTPRAILKYQFNPLMQVYASYAKGTRPGQFNALLYSQTAEVQALVQAQVPGGVPIGVPEEKIDMYEIGYKAELFDRRVRLLVARYKGFWRDKHINTTTIFTVNGVNRTLNVVVPGGSVDLEGIEFQGTVKPTNELTFDATFDYAGSDIKATSCTECLAIAGDGNPVGNRLPRYPAYTGSFSATYERPITDTWNGWVRADYIYTGKQYDTESNLAWTSDYSKVNLRVGVGNDNYEIEGFVTNLFDDDTPTNLARVTDVFTNVNAINLGPAERRTIGIKFSAKY